MILTILAAVFMAYVYYYISNIYVAEEFTFVTKYRLVYVVSRLISFAASVGSYLGYGDTAILYRKYINTLANLQAKKKQFDNEITVEEKVLNSTKIRVYTLRRSADRPLPIFIYYHGGAFVLGSIESYDLYARTLAKALNFPVVTVGYRLSPEYAYPTAIIDCFEATRYILDNPQEFKADLARLIIGGDSAGGSIAAIIVQKLLNKKLQLPKLQILIYPRLQFYTYKLPSALYYASKTFGPLARNAILDTGKNIWRYLGIVNINSEMQDLIYSNSHTLVIEDEQLRQKYEKYLDVTLIPDIYKKDKCYYDKYEKEQHYPTKLDPNSVLAANTEYRRLMRQLLTPNASPSLADDSILKQLPKTYFFVCEWDQLKDQILIYSERLRRNNVSVHVDYSKKCFHGMCSLIEQFEDSIVILNNIVDFIKKNI